jgi:hypothetical protein
MDVALSRVPTLISEVGDQLADVQRALDEMPDLQGGNRVGCFNGLYSDITRRIGERLRTGSFHDPEFLNLLCTEFAKRYISALRRWHTANPAVPAAWSVLFSAYDDSGLPSSMCAAAGVNAHINYDLPFALVASWQQLGIAVDGSPRHRDYGHVNQVFGEAMPGLRRRVLPIPAGRTGFSGGPVTDRWLSHLVESARAGAWARAHRLWPLRTDPVEFGRRAAALDRRTATAGRLLLSPRTRIGR